MPLLTVPAHDVVLPNNGSPIKLSSSTVLALLVIAMPGLASLGTQWATAEVMLSPSESSFERKTLISHPVCRMIPAGPTDLQHAPPEQHLVPPHQLHLPL